MRKNLPLAELGDLFERPILAILATRYRDGRVLLSPVWHEWREGGFNVVTWAGDVKSKHLSRDPRATILVAEQTPPFRSVEVRAEVELSDPPNPGELVRRLATRYYGPVVGPERARAFDGVALELIRLVPGELRSWDFADEFES